MVKPAKHVGTTDQLETLVREAHGACRDLNQLLQGYRKARAELVQDVRAMVMRTAEEALNEIFSKFQHDANANSAELNRAIVRAKRAIIDNLSTYDIRVEKETGKLMIQIPNKVFDDTATEIRFH